MVPSRNKGRYGASKDSRRSGVMAWRSRVTSVSPVLKRLRRQDHLRRRPFAIRQWRRPQPGAVPSTMAEPAWAAVVQPIARRAAVPSNAVPARASEGPSTPASVTAPAALASKSSRKVGASPKRAGR